MKKYKLYTLPKHIKKAENADKELWMRGPIIYPLIVLLALMDAATLYPIFFDVSEENESVLYLLTFGIAIVLNFIPLVIGRFIHYYRYGMNGVKMWMIVALCVALLLLFSATFYLRWEARESILSSASGSTIITGQLSVGKDADSGKAVAYTLLTGIIPLITSIVNLALGYLISDPVKRKLDKLKYLKAAMLEQMNVMYAAEMELDQDWAASFAELEVQRLEAASNKIYKCSDQIRSMARLALAEKLGDEESISELTDKPIQESGE